VGNARVSGLGGVPGNSSGEAARVIAGECPLAPFIPLIPHRGPGADSVGRMAGLLSWITADFSIETVPTGWRLASAPGRDVIRARGFISSDLDAMEEQFIGFNESITMSVMGPVSWAGMVENSNGEKLIRDHGALRELSAAMSLLVKHLLDDLHHRFPDAHLTIQLDEPLVMAATRGEISTASALNTYVALDRQFVSTLWSPIFHRIVEGNACFGVRSGCGDQALSNEYLGLLQESGASRYFDIENAASLGDIIESGKETVWELPANLAGKQVALDLANRIKALGFDLPDFTQQALLVPEQVIMTRDWESARRAWERASVAVDLLNDPDRLLSD
jgi:hypothetical protein